MFRHHTVRSMGHATAAPRRVSMDIGANNKAFFFSQISQKKKKKKSFLRIENNCLIENKLENSFQASHEKFAVQIISSQFNGQGIKRREYLGRLIERYKARVIHS